MSIAPQRHVVRLDDGRSPSLIQLRIDELCRNHNGTDCC